MCKNTKNRSLAIAKAPIDEFGSQSMLSRAIGVSQPSICLWVRNGITPMRENDLRYRFPHLECWKRFPPLTQAKA